MAQLEHVLKSSSLLNALATYPAEERAINDAHLFGNFGRLPMQC